jgi:PBP1b-binding outer membrane lipoprotein LpoB
MRSLLALLILGAAMVLGGCSSPAASAGMTLTPVVTTTPSLDTGAPSLDTGAPSLDTGAPSLDTGASPSPS